MVSNNNKNNNWRRFDSFEVALTKSTQSLWLELSSSIKIAVCTWKWKKNVKKKENHILYLLQILWHFLKMSISSLKTLARIYSQLEQNATLVFYELKCQKCSRFEHSVLDSWEFWTKNGGKPQLGECDARTDAQRGVQAQVATCFKQRYRPLVTDHQAGGNVLSMNLVRPKTWRYMEGYLAQYCSTHCWI